MKNVILFCSATMLLMSLMACSKKNDQFLEPKEGPMNTLINRDKKIKIEIDFFGDFKNYELDFHTYLDNSNGMVTPYIIAPENTTWTSIIKEANIHYYKKILESNRFVIEPKEQVRVLQFFLFANAHNNGIITDVEPMSAIIKVFANGKEVNRYSYFAGDPKNDQSPISVNLDMNSYD